jgi:NADH-quinone oxidoreductase subunit I
VACGLCEAICPAKAISILGGERNVKERYPVKYTLDMSRCVFCGFCEEVCPKEAIVMSDQYSDLTRYNRNNLIFEKDRLMLSVKDAEKRLNYVRNIYSRKNYQ